MLILKNSSKHCHVFLFKTPSQGSNGTICKKWKGAAEAIHEQRKNYKGGDPILDMQQIYAYHRHKQLLQLHVDADRKGSFSNKLKGLV